jgi:hypothetical protein
VRAALGARRLAELRRPGGHGKSELSPAPWCLLHDDLPAVRFYQALDDEQAEARATAALRAPEPAEDAGRLLGRDTRTLVADRNGHSRSPRHDRRLHHSRNGTSTVSDGVLNKVGQDLLDLIGIQPGLGQSRGRLDAVPVLGVAGRYPAADNLPGPRRNVDQLAMDLYPP